MKLTKFELARQQTVEKWKRIIYGDPSDIYCGFCYYYETTAGVRRYPGSNICGDCPITEACSEYVKVRSEMNIDKINGDIGDNYYISLIMAVLLWLMSDDCKSLDDGSM